MDPPIIKFTLCSFIINFLYLAVRFLLENTSRLINLNRKKQLFEVFQLFKGSKKLWIKNRDVDVTNDEQLAFFLIFEKTYQILIDHVGGT
ncbi:MAG: hypothetical protein ACTSWN_11205 [Promethearchaeota archaeon]